LFFKESNEFIFSLLFVKSTCAAFSFSTLIGREKVYSDQSPTTLSKYRTCVPFSDYVNTKSVYKNMKLEYLIKI